MTLNLRVAWDCVDGSISRAAQEMQDVISRNLFKTSWRKFLAVQAEIHHKKLVVLSKVNQPNEP